MQYLTSSQVILCVKVHKFFLFDPFNGDFFNKIIHQNFLFILSYHLEAVAYESDI